MAVNFAQLQTYVAECAATLNAFLNLDEQNQQSVQEKLAYLWNYSKGLADSCHQNFQNCGSDLESFRTTFNQVFQQHLPKHFQQVSETVHELRQKTDMTFAQVQGTFQSF